MKRILILLVLLLMLSLTACNGDNLGNGESKAPTQSGLQEGDSSDMTVDFEEILGDQGEDAGFENNLSGGQPSPSTTPDSPSIEDGGLQVEDEAPFDDLDWGPLFPQ